MDTWQDNFLDALITLDRDEAPHGLYGICRAHASPDRLPSLAQVLYPSHGTSFLHYIGWNVMRARGLPTGLSFGFEDGENVGLTILDYASTKVRQFGSTYRVDLHNRKTPPAPPANLEQLLGGLNAPLDLRRAFQSAVLLVAHVVNARQLETVVGRTAGEVFLRRHSIALCQRQWEDRYARDFTTALYLWSGSMRGPTC